MTQKWVEDADISKLTNRFTVSGMQYDNAGNVTRDEKFSNLKFLYDANNRQRQSSNLDDSNAVTAIYDGAGQRVATKSSTTLSINVYDAFGKLVAEYGQATPSAGSRQYIFADQQGTPRVVLNTDGSSVLSRHDYQPFGEELYSGVGLRSTTQGYDASDGVKQKYAGMEADESGMSHTLWRQYESRSGRWTAPDPYAGSMTIADPQSFNRYTYVNNDPVNKVDLLGLMLSDIGVYQTDNPQDARIAEQQSLRDLQTSVNNDYRSRQEARPDSTLGHESSPSGRLGQTGQQQEGTPPKQQEQQNGTLETDVPDSSQYNCAAWGVGFTDRWIQPGGDGTMGMGVTIVFNRKKDNERAETKPLTENQLVSPNSFPFYFGGKKTNADAALKPDQYKVLVIEDKNNSNLWHVMRQDPTTGKWSSKNGDGARYKDISDPVAFYKQTAYPVAPTKKHPDRNLRLTYYAMPIKLLQPKR